MPLDEEDRLLKPSEVAELFRVDPKTVTRWSEKGKLNAVRTPGGHHRFRESEIRAMLSRQTRAGQEPKALTVGQ